MFSTLRELSIHHEKQTRVRQLQFHVAKHNVSCLNSQPQEDIGVPRQGRQRGDTKGNPEWGLTRWDRQEGRLRETCVEGPAVRGELERQMQTGGGGHTLQVNMPGF